MISVHIMYLKPSKRHKAQWYGLERLSLTSAPTTVSFFKGRAHELYLRKPSGCQGSHLGWLLKDVRYKYLSEFISFSKACKSDQAPS